MNLAPFVHTSRVELLWTRAVIVKKRTDQTSLANKKVVKGCSFTLKAVRMGKPESVMR